MSNECEGLTAVLYDKVSNTARTSGPIHGWGHEGLVLRESIVVSGTASRRCPARTWPARSFRLPSGASTSTASFSCPQGALSSRAGSGRFFLSSRAGGPKCPQRGP